MISCVSAVQTDLTEYMIKFVTTLVYIIFSRSTDSSLS